MKLNKRKLKKLSKQFDELSNNEKIISLTDVKMMINDIIEKTEELENRLSEQMDAIEIVPECDDDSCGCEEVEQTELWDVYSSLEDQVLRGNLYRALRIIS